MTFRSAAPVPTFAAADSSSSRAYDEATPSSSTPPASRRWSSGRVVAIGVACLVLGGLLGAVIFGALLAAAPVPTEPRHDSIVTVAAREEIVQARILGLWAGASATEEWPAILDRTLAACHGAATLEEVIRIVRGHPRARREPNWLSEFLAVSRENLLYVDTLPPGPLCQLFARETPGG